MDEERVYTSDEIAARLNRAAFRALRILMEVRQTQGLYEEVQASRFLRPGTLDSLATELKEWLDPEK